MKIADAWVGIRAATDGFEKELTRGVTRAADKAGMQAGDQLDKSIKGRLQSVRGFLGGGLVSSLAAGLGVGGPIGLAVGGLNTIVDTLASAGQAYSDFNESASKLNAVFPEQAAEIRKWTEASASALGMNQQAAMEAVGTFGNFLQAMGTVTPVAAEMSKAMVQLATDLGSFNNANPEEVLLALQSGLSGETEPLRRFGVDISDAAVQTELLATGVEKVGKNFTQAQKIQGRYALIMRQTKTAQGDFSRTASGTANSTKTAAAATDNLRIKMGSLVNAVQNTAINIAGQGSMALMGVIDGLGNAFSDLQDIIDPLPKHLEAVGSEMVRLAKERGQDPMLAQQYLDAEQASIKNKAELARQTRRLAEQQAALNEETPTEQEQLDKLELDKLDLQQQLKVVKGDVLMEAAIQKRIDSTNRHIDAIKNHVEWVEFDTAAEAEAARAHDEAVSSLSQLGQALQLADRSGLDFGIMQQEIEDRFEQGLSTSWLDSINQIREELDAGRFRILGSNAAEMLLLGFREGGITQATFQNLLRDQFTDPQIWAMLGTTAVSQWVAAWAAGYGKAAPDLTRKTTKAMRDSIHFVATEIPKLGDLVNIEQEKIKNKSGKGWHWKKDISTQLTNLKHQFKTDLDRIQYLMEHPGQAGGKKTEAEITRELRVLDKERKKALSDKNWVAYEAITAKTAELNDELDKLNGRKVRARVDMYLEAHPGRGQESLVPIFGDIFKHSAMGGYIPGGIPRVVGENGPELFVPERSGTVVANNRIAAAAGTRRVDFYVHDPDGGLARAGITTSGLARALATADQWQRYWED